MSEHNGVSVPNQPFTGDWSLVGYCRVSTDDQNCNLQRDAMLAAGIHPDLIFEEIETGWLKKDRPALRNALKACRKGGFLVTWKLDRLGRNVLETMLTLHRLSERGIYYRSLTQPELNTRDNRTATGNFLMTLFMALAQLESDMISERTRAGVAAAKARGVHFGRKTFHQKFVETGAVDKFQALRREGIHQKTACIKVGIPWSTYVKWKDVMEPPEPVDDIGS